MGESSSPAALSPAVSSPAALTNTGGEMNNYNIYSWIQLRHNIENNP